MKIWLSKLFWLVIAIEVITGLVLLKSNYGKAPLESVIENLERGELKMDDCIRNDGSVQKLYASSRSGEAHYVTLVYRDDSRLLILYYASFRSERVNELPDSWRIFAANLVAKGHLDKWYFCDTNRMLGYFDSIEPVRKVRRVLR